ncbi:MAG: hypothetical protein QHJ73_08685, partial [Armatimonadota bacterium]|nr:hypothetical protein [Armatimonadota bacterium]
MFMRGLAAVASLVAFSAAAAAEPDGWWHPGWRYRVPVTGLAPEGTAPGRVIEIAPDFPKLFQNANLPGEFDPQSVRVVARHAGGRALPFATRTQRRPETGKPQRYLAWYAPPAVGQVESYDLYFDSKETRARRRPGPPAGELPPENLLRNPGFEEEAGGVPVGWNTGPLASLGRFRHTTGRRSLKVVVDAHTPENAPRDVAITQQVDVRRFAGQEVLFACDLLAERAAYGAPVSIELQQFDAAGARLPEFAVDPR